MDGLCRLIETQFFLRGQLITACFVDAQLLSAEDHTHLANFVPTQDRHRVTCEEECAGGRCGALKSYTDYMWSHMQSIGPEVEGTPLENPFSSCPATRIARQLGARCSTCTPMPSSTSGDGRDFAVKKHSCLLL